MSHEDLKGEEIPDEPLTNHNPDELHHRGENIEAARLAEKVRVLCWIMTRPETHLKKAQCVKATWGSRCNKLIFMSSQNDSALGAVDLGLGEGRNVLWGKTKAAFKYAYDHHLNDYDWFYKADDDTYTIMENMRYMLSRYDPEFPSYFGSRFNKFHKLGYMSGGGGYVLSRMALKIFVEKGLPDAKACKESNTGAEDAEMGKCLNKIGVLPGDSRDSYGRGRFFPLPPVAHLFSQVPKWYYDYVYYKPNTGLNCCSDTAISFHYIDGQKMYELDYFIYHLRPFGISHRDPYPVLLPPDTSSIPAQLLEDSDHPETESAMTKEE